MPSVAKTKSTNWKPILTSGGEESRGQRSPAHALGRDNDRRLCSLLDRYGKDQAIALIWTSILANQSARHLGWRSQNELEALLLVADHRFHRRPCDRRAFKTGFRCAGFGLSGGGASGFTLRPGARVQFDLIFLPHGLHEIAALLASSTVRAFGGALPPTMPSADFCAAVRPPYGCLSPVAGTQRRPPEVRPTAFTARPPNLPPRSLMTLDFAIACSLVRPGRPRYPVFIHRVAALLQAFFRPHLAMTPLRFANPSPSSGWIEDFHLQAVVHTRHTNKKPGLATGLFNSID